MGTQSYAFNEDRMLDGIAAYLAETKAPKHSKPIAKKPEQVDAVKAPSALPVFVAHTPVSRELIVAVAAKFSLKPKMILASYHDRPLVIARSVIVLILRREHGYSLQRVGNILNRHHTTIMYSERSALTSYELDPKYREIVDSLSKGISLVQRDDLGIPL